MEQKEVRRRQIFGREELNRHARSFAQKYFPSAEPPKKFHVIEELLSSEETLNKTYFYLAEAADSKAILPPGSDWLLDNFHIIEDHIREVKQDLPKGYYKSLPQLRDGPFAGETRVYTLAIEYLVHRDSVFDGELLSSFIASYQSVHKLNIGELWAIPIMLRASLVNNLATLASQVIKSFADRNKADEIADLIIEDNDQAGTEMVLKLAKQLEGWPQWIGSPAIHIMRRLQALGPRASVALVWIEEKFREKGVELDEMIRSEQLLRAADQTTLGNCVTSLRNIGQFDWRKWVEENSFLQNVLKEDPGKAFMASDFTTRDHYRHQIEMLARQAKIPEIDVASTAIELATAVANDTGKSDQYRDRESHVGYFLVDDGRKTLEKHLNIKPPVHVSIGRCLKACAFPLYLLAVISIVTGITYNVIYKASLAGVSNTTLLFVGMLFVVLSSNFAVQVVQWLVAKFVPPSFLPKIDLEKGIPAEAKTLVVVHGIVDSRETIDKLVGGLEVRFLGNEDDNLSFSLLMDLGDSDKKELPTDELLTDHATKIIGDLNRRYCVDKPSRFFLLYRKRTFNSSQGKFMCWERKRGKIMELNKLLLGDNNTSFVVDNSDLRALQSHRYVITLDADAQLPRGSARKLIGTLIHPLNRACVDDGKRVVTKGYCIIQPRVGVSLKSGSNSFFSRIFCGHAGLDPYTNLISDFYQDLFGEASYIGKGIYDPYAFETVLSGRIPENALLSHDLFESSFARTGLASDIELIDDFPTRYNAYTRREHRWLRGDWQLIPWLFPFVPTESGRLSRNPLSWLSWWKIFDNLRRSLVVPSAFALLLGAFTLFPDWPLGWCLFVLAVFLLPVVTGLANSLLIAPPLLISPGYSRSVWMELVRNFTQAILHIAFLPHQAYLALHAIVLTLWRVFVSKKMLLEWETAYHSEIRAGGTSADLAKEMQGGIVLATVSLFLIVAIRPDHLLPASFFLIGWFASPFIASLLSKPVQRRKYVSNQEDNDYLTSVARGIWYYFDDHLVPEYNYLIPDNLQLVPTRIVAERTSPTNIGLSLLSTVSALDLGFTTIPSAVKRISGVLETLPKLERWNGHFLNWYDIRSLKGLPPRYVSSVDSGNLVGNLFALESALDEIQRAPFLTGDHVREIRRSIRVVSDHMKFEVLSKKILQELPIGAPRNFPQLWGVISSVEHFILNTGVKAKSGLLLKDDVDRAVNFLHEVTDLKGMLNWYPLLEDLYDKTEKLKLQGFVLSRSESGLRKILMGRAPTLSLIVKIHNRINEIIKNRTQWFEAHEQGLGNELKRTLNLSSAVVDREYNLLLEAKSQAWAISSNVKLSELYDNERGAFVIGYNIDRGEKDRSHYDLLASEARLTSFVAIARGEIPQRHWFILGRPMTSSLGGRALVSWAGTMFEYLMPILVMHDYHGTILSNSYVAIVKAQQRYARRRGVPWGISESGYAGVDFHKTYQYKAFGIPGLGLKRGLSDDLVISPYSTFLALEIDPKEALANLRVLEKEGGRGEYGFYEAIDYTPQRLSQGERCHVVQSFLAHHQGMSLVSVVNLLKPEIFKNRFHAHALIKATELLLQERFPVTVPAVTPHRAEQLSIEQEEERASRQILIKTPHTGVPITRFLSNGRYTLMIDNAGSGFSMFEGNSRLTRWKEDKLVNEDGTYIYFKDLSSGDVWSATHQPTCAVPDWYESIFDPAKVEFRRCDFGIVSHTEVVVSPDDDVEIRKVSLRNISRRNRKIEITSYGEVVLNDPRADQAHLAFSKMFVQSEFLKEKETLLFWRRKRTPKEKQLFFFHMLTMPVCWSETFFETSRESFLGRGKDVHSPAAINKKLDGKTGSVLDPVFSLRTTMELAPGQAHHLVFVSGVGKSKEDALRLADRYREIGSVQRAFELAFSHSNVELRHQQFTMSQAHAFQRLANALFFTIPEFRASEVVLVKNRLSQSGLWRFGISGDLPVVLVRASEPPHLTLINELILGHEYLRLRGVSFDLVILNEYPGGYFQHFQEELEVAVRAGGAGHLLDKRGGVFIRTLTQLSDDEITLLETVARVELHGTKGSLDDQIKLSLEPVRHGSTGMAYSELESRPRAPEVAREFWNGIGGFIDNGRSYQIVTRGDNQSPLPWSNVIANERFGFVVTERGGGYTWSENSRENRITPWSNDPVSDPCGEVVYVRDPKTNEYWSLTPGPVSRGREYTVTHGFGWSKFETLHRGVVSTLTVSGSLDKAVKWWSVNLRNSTRTECRLELILYLDLVLGIQRDQSSRFLVSSFDERSQTICVRNNYNNEFSGRIIAIGSSLDIVGFTTSRDEFVGRNGTLAGPMALSGTGQIGNKLTKSVGPGNDSAVVVVDVTLAPSESREVVFFLTEETNIDDLRARSNYLASVDGCKQELAAVNSFWEDITSRVKVDTPDKSFNYMMNGWLLYQTLACRMHGRTGFYQSGGAIGFRDQLQDSLAFITSNPELTKKQILLHAAHQYVEGDVQHWWHPPTGRGIRTRISDNLLWLPYAVHRYIESTQDWEILSAEVGFLEGPILEPTQHDLYHHPAQSMKRGSIFDHCVLAIERSLKYGVHGLPFIGAGDWNDGMNEVGGQGKGESVWLGWFLVDVLMRFSEIASHRGDAERFERYRFEATKLIESIEEFAWDGNWYLRAFFDDGTPLGSSSNDECKIDSLAQSWSVITGGGNRDRQHVSMQHALQHLVDYEAGIVKLLTPAFDVTQMEPGYIKGYIPGIRENGGQYTHAATWFVIALARLGMGDKAFELFSLMNPINRTSTQEKLARYRGEPYVLCGDVYSNPLYPGRAGWSWYTGSSGWMYQAGLHEILGVKLVNGSLVVNPCIPKDWKNCKLSICIGNIRINISIINEVGVSKGVGEMRLNSKVVSGNRVQIRELKDGDIIEVKLASLER